MANDAIQYYSDNSSDFSFRENLIKELYVININKKSFFKYMYTPEEAFAKAVVEADLFLTSLFTVIEKTQ